MEGDVLATVSIVVEEERKVSRRSIELSAWSEDAPVIRIRIVDHDYNCDDDVTVIKVDVPMNDLFAAVDALRTVMRGR